MVQLRHRRRAAQIGSDPGKIDVEVDSKSDDRGILGLDEHVPAGPLRTSIRIRFHGSPAALPELEALADWAVAHCPVTDAVVRAVALNVEVSLAD